VVGILASIPFMSQQQFTGPIARTYLQEADISYYVGFLVAGALYLVLGRRRMAERRAAQERPFGTDRARTAMWRLASPSTTPSVRRDEPSQVG
jgi:cytosine/uracil/thiamine/allantoin permease